MGQSLSEWDSDLELFQNLDELGELFVKFGTGKSLWERNRRPVRCWLDCFFLLLTLALVGIVHGPCGDHTVRVYWDFFRQRFFFAKYFFLYGPCEVFL